MGESDFSTLEKVRNVEILPPSSYNKDIPEELERIVLKVLAKDPEDRYQNAIDLHDDLQAFLYTKGELYSRKDLAAWMKKMFPGEIEEENAKAEHLPAGGGPRDGRSGRREEDDDRDRDRRRRRVSGRVGARESSRASRESTSTKRSDMANRGGSKDQTTDPTKNEMEWDEEELDTQIFEKEQTGEPEMLESRDIFEDDDDRTVANEPPPDVLRAATAPNLATPQPSLASRPPHGPATPVSGARIAGPPPGRISGPPAGTPKTLFGMPAPNLARTPVTERAHRSLAVHTLRFPSADLPAPGSRRSALAASKCPMPVATWAGRLGVQG